MDGVIIQAIAIGCGLGLPAIGGCVTVIYKVGKLGQKVDTMCGSVEKLSDKTDDYGERISRVEGCINGMQR